MIILGLDPGYGRLGWGAVEQKGSQLRCLGWGVEETSAGLPHAERLSQVHAAVGALCAKFRPAEAAIEALYFSKNAKTALKVAEARGVIQLALLQREVPSLECQPGQVKLALAGSGSADKLQVTRMVTRLLCLKSAPKPDDAADALALALTALRSRGLRGLQAQAKSQLARPKAPKRKA